MLIETEEYEKLNAKQKLLIRIGNNRKQGKKKKTAETQAIANFRYISSGLFLFCF